MWMAFRDRFVISHINTRVEPSCATTSRERPLDDNFSIQSPIIRTPHKRRRPPVGLTVLLISIVSHHLTHGVVSLFAVCTTLLIVYKTSSDNMKLHACVTYKLHVINFLPKSNVSRPLLEKDIFSLILLNDH